MTVPPGPRLLTMTDVVVAMELADDHHIGLRRAQLPDGIQSAACDGNLYIDPDCEIGRYARLLVDGVAYLVESGKQDKRPQLQVVDGDRPDRAWPQGQVAG